MVTKVPKKAHRTRYGEGSFKWVEKRELWVGRYDTGEVNSRGSRVIISTSSRDEDTAWQRFVAAKKKYLIDGPKLEGVKAGQTVKGWANDWLALHKKNVRPGTFKTDRGHVTKWIIPQIGKVKLEALTASHMRKVAEAMAKEGLSRTTANNAQRTLNKMLNAALADGYKVPERIFAARKASVAKSNRESMSKIDVEKVFTLGYQEYVDALRFFLGVLYGGRQSEVLGITWPEVIFFDNLPPDAEVHGVIKLSWQVQELPYLDKKAGTFDIPEEMEAVHIANSWHFTRPKTDAGIREWPIIAPVAAELKHWKSICPTGKANPHNLVFPRIRGEASRLGLPRNKKADLAEWKELQRRCGIYKRLPTGEDDPGTFYVLHEARHSMISLLRDAGIPKHIIEMLVGQTELVDDYVHGSLESAAGAINQVFGRLLPDRNALISSN